MAYPTTLLITEAYTLSGIVSAQFQVVSGEQLTRGLRLLNSVLAAKSFDTTLIPYYEYTTFNSITGQEVYFIENLLDIETATFNLETVRFSMMRVGRQRYFAYPRVDNIESLPYMWHLERTTGGSNLYLYFKVQQAFPINFMGKFGLLSVTLGQDLEDVFDAFYIEYLRYALMKYICNDYGISMAPETKQLLEEYEYRLKYVSPIDFTNTIRSSMQKKYPDQYAQANLGRGWTT